MPFTEDGICPDIIINPHALPSRMTIGQLLETVMGKASAEYGTFAECTAFNNTGSKYSAFGKLLSNAGFNSSANEILYSGETGEQMRMNIFIGPTYYMRLKHIVKDKINYRAKGPRTVLTRQTVQGRANDGGLRVGEQERDAIVAHGLAYFLKESMLVRGDEYLMAVCNLTGMIAIYNSSLNLFISPFADGPVKFVGELSDNQKIDKITKYGRNFSLVRIPYAFKLLIQELSTLNINMRIITDKNIDQLSSMNPSNKISNLDDIDQEAIIKAQKTATQKPTTQKSITKKSATKSLPPIPSISVKESQELSDQSLRKTIAENIVDIEKLKKQEDEEELDEEELLKALDEVSSPKLNIGDYAQFEPDQLPETTIPDINTVPLIGKTSVNTDKGSESVQPIVTTAIDDPETPDELEADSLKLLTDINKEGEEESEGVKEKTVNIN